MLNYTLGTIEASEALIKDLYIDLRAKVNAWSKITQQTPQARMGELSCITECEAFSSGFILATRIMAEVMQGLEEAENMLQTTVISKL